MCGSISLPALGPRHGAPPESGRQQWVLWVQMLLQTFEPPAQVCFQSTDKVKSGETTGLTGHHHPGDKRSQPFSWKRVNTHTLKGEIKEEKLQAGGEALGEFNEVLKWQSLMKSAC